MAKIFEPSVSDDVFNSLLLTKCVSDCLVSDFIESCDPHDFCGERPSQKLAICFHQISRESHRNNLYRFTFNQMLQKYSL